MRRSLLSDRVFCFVISVGPCLDLKHIAFASISKINKVISVIVLVVLHLIHNHCTLYLSEPALDAYPSAGQDGVYGSRDVIGRARDTGDITGAAETTQGVYRFRGWYRIWVRLHLVSSC